MRLWAIVSGFGSDALPQVAIAGAPRALILAACPLQNVSRYPISSLFSAKVQAGMLSAIPKIPSSFLVSWKKDEELLTVRGGSSQTGYLACQGCLEYHCNYRQYEFFVFLTPLPPLSGHPKHVTITSLPPAVSFVATHISP